MKVYWVLGYDNYYPCVDNFLKSFDTLTEAEEFVKEKEALERGRRHDDYEIINVKDRL